MKTLIIAECKQCGAQYYGGFKKVTINTGEELEVIVKQTPRCDECQEANPRSMGGPKKKFRSEEWQ